MKLIDCCIKTCLFLFLFTCHTTLFAKNPINNNHPTAFTVSGKEKNKKGNGSTGSLLFKRATQMQQLQAKTEVLALLLLKSPAY